MTDNEFQKELKQVVNKDRFKNKIETITYTTGDSIELIGISTIYKYIVQQYKGRENNNASQDELKLSLVLFKELKDKIEVFITNFKSEEHDSNLDNQRTNYTVNLFDTIKSYNSQIFPYTDPRVQFLLKCSYFTGAWDFLVRKQIQSNQNSDYTVGVIMGYEYLTQGSSDIVSRKNSEKKSINQISNDFSKYLSQSEQEITEHLNNATINYNEYIKQLDESKTIKEEVFDSWFEISKTSFLEFDETSKSKISQLEATYIAKLKLAEPAKYWSERADKMRKQGENFLSRFILFIIIVAGSLIVILRNAPQDIYLSYFTSDKSSLIRRSIIYISFISFMAFGIKILSKGMFSSFHLARDAEERYTLTYFYLSLSKDSNIEKEERQLIIQSLFSRADTGLLKDDSAPTMPNDITKLLGR